MFPECSIMPVYVRQQNPMKNDFICFSLVVLKTISARKRSSRRWERIVGLRRIGRRQPTGTLAAQRVCRFPNDGVACG